MFSKPKANVIVSDDGFSIQLISRGALKYTEGPRELIIDCDAGTSGIAIYRSSLISWKPPYADSEITEEIREKIIVNIRNAFLYWGENLVVI